MRELRNGLWIGVLDLSGTVINGQLWIATVVSTVPIAECRLVAPQEITIEFIAWSHI